MIITPILIELRKQLQYKISLFSGVVWASCSLLDVREFSGSHYLIFRQNWDAPIYGSVTTGTTWKFLKLVGQVIEIDLSEYYLSNVNKILGILASGIRT